MPTAKTVLLVDDDPVILALMRKALEVAGYRVLTASDGHQGLALAEQAAPDLVVSDLMMPPWNGWPMIEAIRRWPQRSVPVMLISASDSERLRAHAEAIGVGAYLPKPLDIDQFLAEVRRLCPLA